MAKHLSNTYVFLLIMPRTMAVTEPAFQGKQENSNLDLVDIKKRILTDIYKLKFLFLRWGTEQSNGKT